MLLVIRIGAALNEQTSNRASQALLSFTNDLDFELPTSLDPREILELLHLCQQVIKGERRRSSVLRWFGFIGRNSGRMNLSLGFRIKICCGLRFASLGVSAFSRSVWPFSVFPRPEELPFHL